MKPELRKNYTGAPMPAKQKPADKASASALDKFKSRVATAMQAAMDAAVAAKADAGWTRTNMHHRFKEGR